MPVLSKKEYEILQKALSSRIYNLQQVIKIRSLTSSREGCGSRSHWVDPDKMCATVGSATEIRLAIDDFKTILAEIRRLK